MESKYTFWAHVKWCPLVDSGEDYTFLSQTGFFGFVFPQIYLRFSILVIRIAVRLLTSTVM